MTYYFVKNLLLPVELTDEQMADIPHARFELHVHVAYKTIQAGAILGMGIIGPIIGAVRGRSMAAVKQMAIKGGKVGSAIGVVSGPVMTEGRLQSSKATEAAVYDRSYRIRYNRNQIRVDRAATYGLVGGAAASMALGAAFLPAAIGGFTAGTVAGGIYNSAIGGDASK